MSEFEDTESKICPRCRAEIRPVPIVYGLPDSKLMVDAEAGRIRLGGCIVGAESPDYACPECEAPLPFVNPDRLTGLATVSFG